MSFAWLPIEVQACIITQSLQASPTTANASTSTLSRSVVFDKELAVALSLVSPTCHAIVASTLYRNIHIAKPSALQQFSSTFGRYPEFVKAVRSIHIGPDAELPEKGWPLRMGPERPGDWPELFLVTSLSQQSDEQLLPRWCEPGSPFSFDQAGVGLQRLVIHKALSAAKDDLDVDPRRRRYGISGSKIGLAAWTARLYLLQAALDLYLMEMRKVEDDEGFDVTPWRTSEKATPRQPEGRTRSPTLGAYPALKILRSGASPAAPGNEQEGGATDSNTLVLTIAQLWQHIERRDGPSNHFDSAVLLTRCARDSPHFDESSWSKMRIDLCGPHTAHFSEAEWLHVTKKAGFKGQPGQGDEGDGDSAPWMGEDVYSNSFYAEQDSDINPLDLPSAGVPELLDMARTILFSASQTTNVSLSGYFSRALPALRRMEALRSLNIGRTTGWWEDVGMKPEVVRRLKKNLVKLRVVGKMHSDDAAQICHKLTGLEEVEWVWPDRLAGQAEIYLAMHSLQGRVKANDPANSLENLCRKSLNLGGAKDPQDGSHEFMSIFSYPTKSRRRTTVHLHPDVVEFLQCGWSHGGGNADVHIAWRKGHGVPGAIHTIKLSEISVPGRLKCPIETPVGQGMAIGVNLGNLDVEEGEETEGGMMERIHGRGREWWEEGCTAAEVYELG